MLRPPDIADEVARLAALVDYGLSPDQGIVSLRPIVEIAAQMFRVPFSAVNMVGDDHVFFVTESAADKYDRSRRLSFCAHAIASDEVMVVEDASADIRFHDNPMVTNGQVRFYAGAAVRSAAGHALGALCLVDRKPHHDFDDQARARLRDLASMIEEKLELRRLRRIAEAGRDRFEANAATSPNAIVCFDSHGKVTAWNTAARTLLGYPPEYALGLPVTAFVAGEDHERIQAGMAAMASGGPPMATAMEVDAVRADGGHFPAELHWSSWREDGELHFGAIVRDTTAQPSVSDDHYRLADYDAATGLPNRKLLEGLGADSLAAGTVRALILANLDGLADINNALGPSAGDSALQIVADRVRKVVSPGDLVARIGLDQIAVLCRTPETSPEEFGRRILDTMGEPIGIVQGEVLMVGHCGIAAPGAQGETIAELMANAELALFQARAGAGRGGVCTFLPAFREEAMARRIYDAELYRALERQEFTLHYQPQVQLLSGVTTGAEALIRWMHPTRGLIPPGAFLSKLEAGVLAEPVGIWVLRTACAQLADWRRSRPDFRISVNLFAAQVRSGLLLDVVRETLEQYGLPPQALELEITENIILAEEDSALDQLVELRRLGVLLSFDDFGTGFASLNMLRTYPVTQIKIDRSFMSVLQTSPKDRAIVISLLGLADQIGLGVVAEGVETKADHDFLRDNGCGTAQGYFFSRPVPAPVFEEKFLAGGTGTLA